MGNWSFVQNRLRSLTGSAAMNGRSAFSGASRPRSLFHLVRQGALQARPSARICVGRSQAPGPEDSVKVLPFSTGPPASARAPTAR